MNMFLRLNIQSLILALLCAADIWIHLVLASRVYWTAGLGSL